MLLISALHKIHEHVYVREMIEEREITLNDSVYKHKSVKQPQLSVGDNRESQF